jgi:hypothetical protein
MTASYQLTVTEAQLQCIMAATDLYQRVQLGQWQEIMTSLPLQKPVDWQLLRDTFDSMSSLLAPHCIDNVDGKGSSLGVGHPALPADNSIAYDIHRTIRHKLAWQRAVSEGIVASETSARKWPEMLTVDYDAPMKWSTEPLPTIEQLP